MLDTCPLSQADLIRACQRGDPEAFGHLVTLYKRPVYLLCLRWTGRPDDAEDLAQETFVRALTHIEAVDPERGMRLWLLTIAANLCRNHKRARWRRWQAMLGFFEHRRGEEGRGDLLLRDQLQQGLDGLKTDLRETVLLVWIQGLSHREAGEVLGISEGTVSWRLFKAREKMRVWLAGEGVAGRAAREASES